MVFETQRLYIRQFTKDDLQELYRFSSDPIVMQYIRPPITLEATINLLEVQLKDYQTHPFFGRLAIVEKQSGKYIGNYLIRPSNERDGLEIGYAFFRPYWGMGYATELTRKALDFVFKNLNTHRAFAITHPENIASQAVLFKCGFTQLPDFEEQGKRCCLFECIKK